MPLALWHIDSNNSELREANCPQKNSRLLSIQSLYSLVSIGTERTICTGNCSRELEKNMSVPYMEGSFELPLKYGYSMIGCVSSQSDQRFHFMHPHQSQSWLTKESLTPIPLNIPGPRASLISNMETVINGIWDAHIQQGEKILIIGFGAIGSLLALTLSKHYELDLFICEKDEWRKKKAASLGFKLWEKETNFDTIFHLSGSSAGLQAAIDLCRVEGKVIEMSWYGNKEVSLKLGASFHYGRKSIISSQVSSIPGHKKGQWNYKNRKELAISYLEDKDYDQLLSYIIPFSEGPQLFDKIRNNKLEPGLNWVFQYSET